MAANPIVGPGDGHGPGAAADAGAEGSGGAPPPARMPLGCLAAGVLIASTFGLLLGAGTMVFGLAPVVFVIPAGLIACFFVAQVVVSRVLRLPVRGPDEPMGTPEDDAPDEP